MLMAQVITEYRKARALMAENATTPKGGVWQSLFQEVEKVRCHTAAYSTHSALMEMLQAMSPPPKIGGRLHT